MRQPKIRYFLEATREGQRDKPELVMASISYGYTVLRNGRKRSTPFKVSMESPVLPKHFGKKEMNYVFDERVFSKHSKNYGHFVTTKIQLEGAVNKLAIDYQSKSQLPTPKEFQHSVKVEMGQIKIVEKGSEGIVDYLQKKIEYYQNNSGANKKDSKRESTIKGYRSLLFHLQDYQLVTNTTITFDKFSEDRYWQFWQVIDNIYRGIIEVNNPNRTKKRTTDSYGYAAKTIQKYQKNLLAFFRVVEKEVPIVLDLNDSNLVLGETKASKSIYVTENELKLIYDTNVSFDKDLQAAKDFILISSLTGLRYEGVVEASKALIENYDRDGYSFQYVHVDLGKVNSVVCVPLLNPVREIARRHSGSLPAPPSNQEINAFLKDLYRHLNIREEVEVTKTNYKGEVYKVKALKCDVISCHDGRRGFITNLDLWGARRSTVSDMTHPAKVKENAMHDLYNKSTLLDKARHFVDEVKKFNSQLYRL